jgi:hypothetical protein
MSASSTPSTWPRERREREREEEEEKDNPIL